MDPVDIASEFDFTEERLRVMRSKTQKEVARGACLYCKEPVESVASAAADGTAVFKLYCDDDCRLDYEAEQKTLSKQRRS